MKKYLAFFMAVICLHTMASGADEKNIVSAVLKSATVYRTAAELTHQARAVLKQGANDLIIEGLSNGLDIGSVQIGAEEKLTILSVEFSTEFLKPAIRTAAVKKLDDSLEIVNREINRTQVLLKTDLELIDLLKANREIRGTQAGLSVAELMKMMDYYKTKSLETQNEIAQYQDKLNRLNELSEKVRLQINEEEQKNTKTTGRLNIQLISATGGVSNLTISYITSKAYWNPFYDIRVENISKPVSLLYKAKLVQTTGIDWKQVKLTLATAAPNQNSNAPILKSWFLDYTNPVSRMENNLYMNSVQSALQGAVPGLAQHLEEVAVVGYGTEKKDASIRLRGVSTVQDKAPLYVLNGVVIEPGQLEKIDPKTIKSMDVVKDANATAVYGSRASNGVVVITLKDELSDYISVKDSELNVSFDIDLPYDVPGNGKEQTVSLKEFPVNTIYKYYAVPKLDKDAYLLGEVADWEQLNLLPGEANIIFEGTYIGKSYIDPNSTMDTLNLTLHRAKLRFSFSFTCPITAGTSFAISVVLLLIGRAMRIIFLASSSGTGNE